jgi:hypothetical protein
MRTSDDLRMRHSNRLTLTNSVGGFYGLVPFLIGSALIVVLVIMAAVSMAKGSPGADHILVANIAASQTVDVLETRRPCSPRPGTSRLRGRRPFLIRAI